MVLMHQFSYKPASGNWLLNCGILFVFRFVSKYSAIYFVFYRKDESSYFTLRALSKKTF